MNPPPQDSSHDRPRYPPAPQAGAAGAREPRRADAPAYTRYRARPRLFGSGEDEQLAPEPARVGRPRRLTPRRLALALIAVIAGWLLLSLVLFLFSSHFERVSPPADVNSVLDPGGFPLTSATNILVLGSDQRQKSSKEPGANTSGPSRSDTIMLVRTGGGHSARLSIPRDTVVEIPGHGEEKINAAYAFGGPKLAITVLKRYLGIPINHVVIVSFEDFPALVDAMGGVDYSGGCVIARVDGGYSNGGVTLRLKAGTHHLDGREALALARTRENLCDPRQSDLERVQRQQRLLQEIKSRLLSPASFLRLPLIAWNAPPTIISDMSGPTLLGLFAALELGGTPPTRVLQPQGAVTLPDGETGLRVPASQWRAAAARFMAG